MNQRQQAMNLLAHASSDEARDALLAMAEGARGYTKVNALELLSQNRPGDPAVNQMLVESLFSGRQDESAAAAWALARAGSDEARDALLAAMQGDDARLAVAATLPKVGIGSGVLRTFLNLDRAFLLTARICVAPTLVLNGIQHFVFPQFVASLIPAWFPGNAAFWTAAGGALLIAGGIGLLIPRTARLAALLSGLMIFSWFFIVHVSREIAGVADGIAVFEALLTAGLLFVLTSPTARTGSAELPRKNRIPAYAD